MKEFSCRIEAWDILKTFAIFLVVMGHFLQYMVSWPPFECPLFAWIQTFHMPLFMAISGFLSVRGYAKGNFKAYCKKRFMRIMIPCISWLVLIFLLKASLSDGGWSFTLLKNVLINDLWFLKSLFVCCLLGFVAYSGKKHRVIKILVTIFISQIFWMWNVFTMYPCFLCGACIYIYWDFLMKNAKWILAIFGLFFIATSFYLSYTPDFWVVGQGIRHALLSGEMPVESRLGILLDIVGRRYFTMMIGISASVFFILGSYLLFNKVKTRGVLKIMADAGKYTLGIYAVQTVLVENLLVRFIKADSAHSTLYVGLIFPCLSIIVMIVSVWMNVYIQKNHPVVSAILFGDKK